ncbi:MAG TPA: hypothetical protein VGO07_02510 [Candidatus Saccharimonadales bacterium]|jgi:5,10-methylene-tetrahydrofolate dehydrogenase/methenyl tetrahydrofolate cyclohydrolase|nr:hypothetical protein [Candidatus Saccharimonadales bacterium]
MAIEYDVPGFSTGAQVALMYQEIAPRAEMYDGDATVAFVLPDADPPSLSYAVEALAQAGTPGLRGEVWLPGEDGKYRNITDINELRRVSKGGLFTLANDNETLRLIQELNERDGIDLEGVVPLNITPGTLALKASIDLDGVTSESPHVPATPVSMLDVANAMLQARGIESVRDLDPSQIVVLGNGGVAGPLVAKVLPGAGVHVPPENHYKNRNNLDAGAERLATDTNIVLGFTATRAPGNITDLTPNTILIDYGYATMPDSGRETGNAHPDLVQRHGEDGRDILAFRGGGGPITIAHIYGRAVARRLARVGQPVAA